MSLLTSLIKASTQFQSALEKRPAAAADQPAGKAGDAVAVDQPSSPTDDRFTRTAPQNPDLAALKSRQLSVTDYKQTVGQDLAFVRETLRHKLAEYGMHPATAINVTKGDNGNVQVEGKVPEAKRGQIEQDLNNNKGFQDAFSRLSVNEPTLHFVDNALKLNRAYGVNNSLLDTLVSDNQQFNGLQDLVHRYDTMRKTVSSEQLEAAGVRKNYAFNFNTRA
ncbi:hypothetical protein [Marinobacter goseongensis]|uniref:hypothetical protein n=1 Tax=Marinobacter goseongensis TaxID=453838 RepID=UPI002006B967|nr:hypothetical protein [Marinobacter goseongensis]